MKVNWPTEKLGDVLKKNGIIPVKIKCGEYRDNGKYPVIDQGEDYIAGFINDEQKLYQGDLPVVIFGDHTRILKYVDFPFAYGADGIKILKPREGLLPKFFYYTLLFKPVQNLGYKRHFSLLKNQKIPVPPLEIQKQIVERLDKIVEAQKLNDELIQKTDELYRSLLFNELNAKLKTQNLKLQLEIKKLSDVAEIIGGFAFKSDKLTDKKVSGSYLPVIKIGNVLKSGDLNITNVQYYSFDNSLKKYLINRGDVLVAMTGATVGKVVCSPYDNLLLNQRVGLIRVDKNIADQNFVGMVLRSKSFYDYCQRTAGGGAQGNISPSQIMQYEIILPPLKTQKQIVAKLSAVQDYKKQLIEQKTKLKELFDSVLHKSMSGEV